MKLSLKQLTVSLSLLVIGGGAGLLGSRYLTPQNRFFNEAKNVSLNTQARNIVPNPVGGVGNNVTGENINFIAAAARSRARSTRYRNSRRNRCRWSRPETARSDEFPTT